MMSLWTLTLPPLRSLARLLAVLVLVGAVGLTDAEAARKKGKGKKKNVNVELTGVRAFDDVFVRVREIDRRLNKAEKLLRTGRQDLNTALGLKKKSTFTQGIAELRKRADGKLAVVMKGNKPTLQATDAVPTKVQAGIDAVNRLTNNISTSMEELAGVPKEARALVQQAQVFPQRLKQELEADPITTLFKAPKVAKTLKGNLKVTSELPKRSTKVMGRMNDMVTVVRKEFPLKQEAGGGTPARPSRGR